MHILFAGRAKAKGEHMKAAVLCEQPGDLVIEELAIDKLGPQEVLIQTVGAVSYTHLTLPTTPYV